MEFNLNAIASRPTGNYIRAYFMINRNESRICCGNIRRVEFSEGELIPFLSFQTPIELMSKWEFELHSVDDTPSLIDNMTLSCQFNIGTEEVLYMQIHVFDTTSLASPGHFSRFMSHQCRPMMERLYGEDALIGWSSITMSFDYYGVECFEWMKEVMYWIYQYISVDESDPYRSDANGEFQMEQEDWSYGRFTTCEVKYVANPCPIRCFRDYHVRGIKKVKLANKFHSLLSDPAMIAPLESILDMLMGESTKLNEEPIDPKRLMVLSVINAINNKGNKRMIEDVE